MDHIPDARNQLERDYNGLMELSQMQANQILQVARNLEERVRQRNVIGMANHGLRLMLDQRNRQNNVIGMANHGLMLMLDQRNRQNNVVGMASQGLRLMLEQRNQQNHDLDLVNTELRQILDEQQNTEAALRNENNRLTDLITDLVNGQNQEKQLIIKGFKSVKDKADQAENWQRQCHQKTRQIQDLESQHQLIQRQTHLIQNQRIQLVDRVKYLEAHIQAIENQNKLQIKNFQAEVQGFEAQIQSLQNERNQQVQSYEAQIQLIQNQRAHEVNNFRVIENDRNQLIQNLVAQIHSIVHERNQQVQHLGGQIQLILNEKNKQAQDFQAKMKSIQNLTNQIVPGLETGTQLKQNEKNEQNAKKNNKQTKNQVKMLNDALIEKEKQIYQLLPETPTFNTFNGQYAQNGRQMNRTLNFQNQRPKHPNPEEQIRRFGRIENNYNRGNYTSKQNQIRSLSQQRKAKYDYMEEEKIQKVSLATVRPKNPTQKQIKPNYQVNQNILEPKQVPVNYYPTGLLQKKTLEQFQFFKPNQCPIDRNPPLLTPFYDQNILTSHLPYQADHNHALNTAFYLHKTSPNQNYTYSTFPNQGKKQTQKPNKNASLEQKPTEKIEDKPKNQEKKCLEQQHKNQPLKPNAVVDERSEIQNEFEWHLQRLLSRVDLFPNLVKIILRSKQITDQGLILLSENGHKLKNLQKLSLHSNQITDRGLKVFAENGGKFPNLQCIYFGNNKITDEGLKALVENGEKFENMKQIHVQKNKITDEGLTFLAQNGNKFKKLENVYLQNNDIKIKNSRLDQLKYEYKQKFTISK